MMKFYTLFSIRKLSIFIFILSAVLFNSQTASQNYTTAGTYTFTVPTDVTSVTIRAWGAGGGGGGGTNASALRGGGGGGFSSGTFVVTPGATYTVVVGAGGSGNGNPGGAGGASIVKNSSGTIILSAAGGNGGGSGTGIGGQSSDGVAPALGGIKYSGGNGGTNGGSNNGGGGGGSAGSTGNGGNGGNGVTGSGGSGGSAGSGTPSGADGGSGGTRNILGGAGSGNAGSSPGGGGGGRSSSFLTSTTSGGSGAAGQVTIIWATNTTDLSVTKTANTTSPSIGDAVTFNITAKNNKTSTAATNVVLTDLLPSGYTFVSANQSAYNQSTGVWNIGTLAANTTTTLTIVAVVKDFGVYNNTASITSTTMPDDNNANDSSTVTMTVCKATGTAPQVQQ